MAHPPNGGLSAMSVVPYDSNRQVVLRHADSVVVYDSTSRQLVLRNASKDVDSPREEKCPHCHQPLPKSPHPMDHDEQSSRGNSQPSFINHDYFQMLHQSLPASSEASAPSSPRRRLVQPVQPVVRPSAPPPEAPPPGAEFVGSSPAPPNSTHGISTTAFSPKYFENFFTVEKELGRGGRGVVLLVRHVLDGVSLGYFACKRVPIGDDHAWLEKVLVEVQLLQNMSHQNLVSYRHVWLQDYKLSPFSPSVPCAFILQQYCNGGDLHNYICGSAIGSTTTQDIKERMRRRSKGEADLPANTQEPRKLQFDEIYSFFRDITSGLRYLHMSGFIHRDLKPSNCLLHTTGVEMRVLVSDFGEVQYESSIRKSTGATGTISYCAPEVLTRVAPDGPYGNFTFKSDIFSLGMILYFLCFAKLPYQSANVLHEEREDAERLRQEITQWEGFFDDERKLRPELPEKLYAFLRRLLSINPDDRPSAAEVDNGIRTGAGLHEIPESPIRRNSIGPEELSPGRRIVRLDSPARATSPKRANHAREQSQTSALSRVIPPNQRRRQISRGPPSIDTSRQDQEEENHSADRPPNPRTRSRNVVLHSPVVSPQEGRSPDFKVRSPLLLPPARTERPWYQLIGDFLMICVSPRVIRVVVLVAKIVSLLQPCASRGINPQVVYPMMLLAISEFSLGSESVVTGGLAMAIHVIVLGVTLKLERLCAAPIWDDS